MEITKKEELRIELNEITRIFMSAKYLSEDFVSIYKVGNEYPETYNNFHFFINRMWFAVTVNLILDLSKLFDTREKYSLGRLFNKMTQNYNKSEFNNSFPEKNFLELKESINDKGVIISLNKIKTLRDTYYAHLDRTRPNIKEISVNAVEIKVLINTAEKILQTLESGIFGIATGYDLSDAELGYDIFRRVDEWEKYYLEYGFLE